MSDVGRSDPAAAAQVRAPLDAGGDFRLRCEVRCAHRLVTTTPAVASEGGGARADEAPEVVWATKGKLNLREREISAKALLEIAVIAECARGDVVVGKAVAPMATYRDGYPRRAWMKLGDRATGKVEAWRGAVDTFIVWAHDEDQAWDAELQQVKAKAVAKAWREENAKQVKKVVAPPAASAGRHLREELDAVAAFRLAGAAAPTRSPSPPPKGAPRRSTAVIARELFGDANHRSTHVYLPEKKGAK